MEKKTPISTAPLHGRQGMISDSKLLSQNNFSMETNMFWDYTSNMNLVVYTAKVWSREIHMYATVPPMRHTNKIS